MTTSELNAEVLRNLSIVAEDENLLRRVAKYLRRVVAEKQNDPTLMTKEEFFAKLEKGEEEYLQGKYYEMLPGESLDDFLKRVGWFMYRITYTEDAVNDIKRLQLHEPKAYKKSCAS